MNYPLVPEDGVAVRKVWAIERLARRTNAGLVVSKRIKSYTQMLCGFILFGYMS